MNAGGMGRTGGAQVASPGTQKTDCDHVKLSADDVARVLAKPAAPAAANATTAPLERWQPDRAVARLPYISSVLSSMTAAWVAAAAALTKASFAKCAVAEAAFDACFTEMLKLLGGSGSLRQG